MANDVGFKKMLVGLAFLLFSVFIVGLFWLATTPEMTVSVALSYAAGLSMIILPCTLPLVFIVVPLSMGKGYRKGLFTAISFGLGLTVMITIYGVVVALIGQYLGLDQATRVMFVLAGTAAFVFGLSELKLISFEIPGISAAAPRFIEERKGYVKSFFMGLFLGNAGIGCPNPAFYVLLTYIASVGSAVTGGWLGFVHGLGRATPLIFISILAILGINMTQSLVKSREKISKIMGWALVFIGAFLLVYGLLGMGWWEESIFHVSWNEFVAGVAPQLAEVEDHPVVEGMFEGPVWSGWVLLFLLFEVPALWYLKKRGAVK